MTSPSASPPADQAGTVLDTAAFDAANSSDGAGLTYPTVHHATGGADGFGYMNARNGTVVYAMGPSYAVSAGDSIKADMLARTASGGGTYWQLCSANNAGMSGATCTSTADLPAGWTARSVARVIPAGHTHAAIQFVYSVEYDLLRISRLGQ